MKVALISCGKAKREGSWPAKDLYTSSRFRKCIKLAERDFDAYFILSALHGLVRPETKIENYNVTMKDLSKEDALNWAWKVTGEINKQVPKSAELHLFAGKAYFNGLGQGLEAYSLHYPLLGMKPGFVLQYLNDQLYKNSALC